MHYLMANHWPFSDQYTTLVTQNSHFLTNIFEYQYTLIVQSKILIKQLLGQGWLLL